MMNELYNQRILKLAAEIPHIGSLDAPQATADAVSRLCGSKVHVELSLAEDNIVAAFAHEVEACALGQASSAVMAREIIGCSPQELRDVGAAMRAMLRENGAPPSGKWADLEVLEPVRAYKNRHASTLLTFDAVEDCLQQLGV
ncbi:iron-sulfur cluster assembly scaffold protein [Alphaproteobacteria bacterium]|nr:iron-sulfur cluster assembly scaffold protein [bacterium]MDA8625045.1 iron-sulfur cluster assembly scaffold protein [Alphaproteobacteria bacterium]MDA8642544.1 iron-sulfur cluster assembly scaffold protein [Alphaproteobacteria bacterium]MDA8779985.1 iron-sulfur cluster assembly scaffold protein [Alphaproteobacteria bacterium]MDA9591114.1 iron-sulfur cluster assembly scaffold protein [Alphaproteobacteria bacterium]